MAELLVQIYYVVNVAIIDKARKNQKAQQAGCGNTGGDSYQVPWWL